MADDKTLLNRQWLLAARPQGKLKLGDFEYRETPFAIPDLEPGEILLNNRVFACAPTMRNFMNPPGRSYRASVPLGTPVTGVVGAEVIASNNPDYPVGTQVNTVARWEDYSLLNPAKTEVPVYPIEGDIDLMEMMGPLSLNSLTAYYGLFGIGKPAPGETVVVSGAAGSVGTMACQFARIHGCRVIGIAGGPEKCAWLLDTLGVDGAIDYKGEDVSARLRELCPDGVDVFFDNVGGEILDAVMENIAPRGRIAVCGQVSAYNSDDPAPGPRDMMKLVYWRVRIEGFVLGDFADGVAAARQTIRQWFREGKLVARQDIRHGFAKLPESFLDLFEGANEGSLLVTAASD
ncbi:NADP-dependent oxidoreductase [Rhizorhabdus dicambivorans]|uniref:NADP-dependent oxidoreductase n=1 Tax=Rhizorhabdus dicambivorans TaxID=1850238 RepID=A0A2A4FSS4_9SPHN|nr:NADP-dependent oxidoreductase [Rhizorhabdus dicambivorans]ATE64648.1 NADP-dependent oxidoreductase [Rhizorhabdus dicambivorans]PCE40770.1 NADP-dependent oxidoreductase [Rhizorhabdus dicambivorans]